jgi:hypothetical protein
MIPGRYQPGIIGKKTKKHVFQKNEMLAQQVGALLFWLKYNNKTCKAGWDG